MHAKLKEIRLPQALINLWADKEKAQNEITKAVVLDLLRKGEITSSFGAELLEINYHDFLDLISKEDVPLINYESSELEEEVKRFEGILHKNDRKK